MTPNISITLNTPHVTIERYIKRAKLFKIDMKFFQDKPEARIWKLFKIKQRH